MNWYFVLGSAIFIGGAINDYRTGSYGFATGELVIGIFMAIAAAISIINSLRGGHS